MTAVGGDGKPYGMTCSSLCSVALTPPTLLVCLRGGSPTLDAVLVRAAFTVNLLHDRARPAADLFASGKPDRFGQIAWRHDDAAGGPHLIEHAHVIADCDVSGPLSSETTSSCSARWRGSRADQSWAGIVTGRRHPASR